MSPAGSFTAPPGFRESPMRPLGVDEVVASTYIIRDEIARTDDGIVFEARDMMLDRLVALKLAWRDPGNPSLIAEARRCAAVRAPCAVQIHGMGTHNGVEFAVGERVTGRQLAAEVTRPLAGDLYISRLRTLTSAVTYAHEAGIAVGSLSGHTVLVAPEERLVLGRLSLSQVSAFGRHVEICAPEVARGEVSPDDPAAAEALDLYALGCIAIEMASGKAPFADRDHQIELNNHAVDEAPRLAQLRPDLPGELSDLVEWLLDKQPAARPRSARDVLSQIDAIIERGADARTLRVLIVDGDASRARWFWSLVRRAHAGAVVETAAEGTDAAHKLNRDQPDVVFIDAALKGVMNALELCMYARGLIAGARSRLVIVGTLSDRDRSMFAEAEVAAIPRDGQLANAVLDNVRAAAAAQPKRRKARTTVSG
jgi:CheY-like chemotaxis protein